MNPKSLQKAARLSQRDATWQCTVRRAPVWITPDDTPPYRPYVVMVLDAKADRIRRTEIQEDRPLPDFVLETLVKAMLRPVLGSGWRYRPERIVLDDASLVQELTPRLAKIGVRCEYRAKLSLIDGALREMATHMNQQEPPPGLLSVPGATIPLVAELFAAAAEFYRRAPWLWMDNFSPVEIRYPADGSARYGIILGYGGEVFGLAVYPSLDDLRVQYSSTEPEQAGRRISAISLTFEEPMFISFEDLDALEKYQWPIAGTLAYPQAIKITPPEKIGPPSASEIACLAAALRTLPDFVEQQLQANPDPARPAEATYPLPNVHSGQKVTLRYPVELPGLQEQRDQALEEESLDEFIEEWYHDERSYEFARQMGQFLFQFLDYLETTGLSDQTIEKHEKNCWMIGRLTSEYGHYKTFSPTIFLGEPKYLAEFQQRVSRTKSALASYKATWRKLEKYVRALGYE